MVTRKIREHYEKYFFLIFGLILFFLVFLIIKPFIHALLISVILAYISYSLYAYLNRRINNENVSAFLTTAFVFLIIVVPLFFAFNSIAHEAYRLYQYSREPQVIPDFMQNACKNPSSILCRAVTFAASKTTSAGVNDISQNFFQQLYNGIGMRSPNWLSLFTSLVVNFFIVVISTFFLLKDGKRIIGYSRRFIPLDKKLQERFIIKFKEMSNAVIFGQILIAFIQGVLASLFFFIFGVESPLIWGVITFIVSVFPIFGPYLIYVPLGLFKVFEGISMDNPYMTFNGIFILLTGFFIISLTDNFLRYAITGARSKQHPLLVLIGVLGGFNLMGIVGLFFGPIILVVAFTMLEMVTQKNEIEN